MSFFVNKGAYVFSQSLLYVCTYIIAIVKNFLYKRQVFYTCSGLKGNKALIVLKFPSKAAFVEKAPRSQHLNMIGKFFILSLFIAGALGDCSNCDDTVSHIKSLIALAPDVQDLVIETVQSYIVCPDDGAICDLDPSEVIDFLDNFDFCNVLANNEGGEDSRVIFPLMKISWLCGVI